MPYLYTVDGETIETDYAVQTVGELRQEIAMKSAKARHIFSRVLMLDGEPLMNRHQAVFVSRRKFTTRK